MRTLALFLGFTTVTLSIALFSLWQQQEGLEDEAKEAREKLGEEMWSNYHNERLTMKILGEERLKYSHLRENDMTYAFDNFFEFMDEPYLEDDLRSYDNNEYALRLTTVSEHCENFQVLSLYKVDERLHHNRKLVFLKTNSLPTLPSQRNFNFATCDGYEIQVIRDKSVESNKLVSSAHTKQLEIAIDSLSPLYPKRYTEWLLNETILKTSFHIRWKHYFSRVSAR